jgi:16S rRNA (guanine527-N7)-methyltransferase
MKVPNYQKVGISDSQIAASLAPFGVQISGDQILKIREYLSILLKWNDIISLTAITDPAEIVSRHFGESMYVASITHVENGRLADVGTGAGFPGLALKILCPNLHTVLIEPNKKKSAFLAEVVRVLGLADVEIIDLRFEEFRAESGLANFIASRAMGGYPKLLKWSKRVLADRGHVILWVGGEDTTSISNATGWTWRPAVRIPESQRRFILIGRPASN